MNGAHCHAANFLAQRLLFRAELERCGTESFSRCIRVIRRAALHRAHHNRLAFLSGSAKQQRATWVSNNILGFLTSSSRHRSLIADDKSASREVC